MWELVVVLVILLVGSVLVSWTLRRMMMSQLTRERLAEAAEVETSEPPTSVFSPIMRRWRWLVVLLGLITGGSVWLVALWPWPYTVALTVMFTMLLWQLEAWWLQFKTNRAQQQLADSIDLMVAAVKAGSSLQGALESAMENTPAPWKNELRDLVARIRYGDEPAEVLRDLSQRVPLETVRLFSQTLSVNWSVGGRLSLALANVGRTIRDRLELSRRMQTMTTQARLSVISVIAVTYFIGALMWRNDPERMGDYLGSLVGQGLVTTAMLLQAVGIVWIAQLSTPRF